MNAAGAASSFAGADFITDTFAELKVRPRFLGAVIAHLRAGASHSLSSPLLLLALAVTTLALAVTR